TFWARASRARSTRRAAASRSTTTATGSRAGHAKANIDGSSGADDMSNLAYDEAPSGEPASDSEIAAMAELRPVPRISIQAFCETEAVAGAIERAGGDRRMAKTHLKVHMGGIATAVEFYQSAQTPNLIIV